MSWASRRRTSYALGVIIFFLVVIGGPLAYWYFSIPASCTDGIQNQGETKPDRGGPCPLLDTSALSPASILWTRAFRVRDGSYNAVAYIQNQNINAGVTQVAYRFGLYDANNVLVAEKIGMTPLMPSTITPVFSGAVDTGNRVVTHAYFEFTEPLKWQRLSDTSTMLSIHDTTLSDEATVPRVEATVTNTSVKKLSHLIFIVTIFDPAGNAFAASQTAVDSLEAATSSPITFTWPDPFRVPAGRVDIRAVTAPAAF
ncbi:MAG: hypothetical protein JWM46_467 [Candidatus Kaiserbacteria bacterium]|nr:hypothetical protein [Candidatus Kaiserbacteria bacterium]